MRCSHDAARRRSAGLATGLLIGLTAGTAAANPHGPQIVNGSVSMHMPNAATLEITNSAGAIINWQAFSIGAGETTRFIQPSAASAVLNRVTGGDPSAILGSLLSNGQVFLINRNGILFGRHAVVDTAGLVASALDMDDADFIAGRLRFTGDPGAGTVRNEGYIKAGANGDVYLIAPGIENSGIIETDGGEIVLAAGQVVDLVSLDSDYVRYELRAPENEVLNLGKLLARGGAARIFAGTIRNSGVISADSVAVDDSGVVELRATHAIRLEQGGVVSATGTDGAGGGTVSVVAQGEDPAQASVIAQDGEIDASGASGGSVTLAADRVTLTGATRADGDGAGGAVRIEAAADLDASASALVSASGAAGDGGRIVLEAGERLHTDALHLATGERGGTVHLLGREVHLTGALVDVRGARGGGEARIGGGFQGGEDLPAADYTTLDPYTRVRADAIDDGDAGSVVIWSQRSTRFFGHVLARGGWDGGDGGAVEVSGDSLVFEGSVDVSAPKGQAGSLLLDPQFISIVPGGTVSTTAFTDPNPGAGSNFGGNFDCFSAGSLTGCSASADRILFYDPFDDFAGLDAGAVYLFNFDTGAPISTLTGAAAGDRVGSGGLSFVANLPAGQVLLRHPNFNGDGGAFTPFNVNTGLNGKVSASNSIIGNPGDQITASSFNFSFADRLIMTNPNWGGGRGAATLLNRNTFRFASSGGFGTVSAANSVVGAAANDFVGNGGVQFLSSTAVLVRSPSYNGSAGALTPFTATGTVPTGVISASNSLFGSTAGDNLGSSGINTFTVPGTALVLSPFWNNGAVADAGAVTALDPATGRFKIGGGLGAIGAANSLVGSNANDRIGVDGVFSAFSSTAGSVGWVSSTDWNGFAGAFTYFSATVTPVGAVSASNSILGANAGDNIGSNVFDPFSIPNRTLVLSPNVGSGLGAITLLNNDNGQFAAGGGFGAIDGSNSLVGLITGDALGSGNTYGFGTVLVHSPAWNGNAGALTPVSATIVPTGTNVTASSVVGDAGGKLGSGGIDDFTLSTKIVVASPDALGTNGAITVIDRTTGEFAVGGGFGVIDNLNSLAGDDPGDALGSDGLQSTGFGTLLALSPGAISGGGAITFFSDTVTPVGSIDNTNSVFGNPGDDLLGFSSSVDPFSLFGRTIVLSPDFGVSSGHGAVVVLDSATGQFESTGAFGLVTSANSLFGANSGDAIGDGGLFFLDNGDLLVHSTSFDSNAGALTHLSASGPPPVGFVDNTNSIFGAPGDQLGSNGVNTSGTFGGITGKAIVFSPMWGGGRGAVTVIESSDGSFSTAPGTFGLVDASNSLVGTTADATVDGDRVGSGGFVFTGSSGLVSSPKWNSTAAGVGAGAWTFLSDTVLPVGPVGAGNSIIGNPGDQIGSGGINTFTVPGKVLLFSPLWDNGANLDAGAISLLDSATGQFFVAGAPAGFGLVGAGNSLVGANAGDSVGNSTSLFSLGASGNFMLRNPGFNGGAGAVTWFDPDVGIANTLGAGNSLVGASASDAIGSFSTSLIFLSGSSNLVLRHSAFNGGAGAVTWFDPSAPITGTVGTGNSLVGASAGDNIGSAGIATLDGTRFAIYSPLWDNGAAADAGAITYASLASGLTGTITTGNSLVGTQANDRVGNSGQFGFVNLGATGNRYYRNSNWRNLAGALTLFRAGLAPPTGAVSATNSLVGSTANDFVGSASVQFLFNNRIAIRVPNWDNGAAVDAGAVVMGTTAGLVGAIGPGNALVGTHSGDVVGSFGLSFLSSTSYLVRSPSWNNGRGAVTFLSPTALPTGAITATNSFIGATDGDGVGNQFQSLFGTTQFALMTPNWDNGAVVDAGAFTVFDGATGITGTPSATNSLVGSNTGDRIGSGGLTFDFGTFNFVLRSPQWNMNAGAATFMNAAAPLTGTLGLGNSLVGGNPGDMIGSGGVLSMGSDRFMVISPQASVLAADGSLIAGAGRVDILNGGALGGGVALDPTRFAFNVNPAGSTVLGALDMIAFLNGGGSLVLQAHSDIRLLPGADILAKGGSLTLQAGRSIILEASIDPVNLFLLANDTSAGIDPALRGDGPGDLIVRAFDLPVIIEADNLVASAQNILVQGGEFDGAFAALGGLETVQITADMLTLLAGSGANADAVLFAASGDLEFNVGLCEGCVDLVFDPLEDPLTQTGIFKGFPNFSFAIDSVLAMGDPALLLEGEEESEEDEEERQRRLCR